MSNPDTKTIQYFYSEVCRFRDLMGQKSFWGSEAKCEKAVFALGYIYLNLGKMPREDEDRIKCAYWSTMDEYMRRSVLVSRMLVPAAALPSRERAETGEGRR